MSIDRMLRINFLQHWFNLFGPEVEEVLYDTRAIYRFVGTDSGLESGQDETTICKLRHLLERHNLGDRMFSLIAAYGLKVSTGTIVDITIISTPSSTKNKNQK